MANDWDVPEHLAKLVGFNEDTAKTFEGDGQQHKRKEGGLVLSGMYRGLFRGSSSCWKSSRGSSSLHLRCQPRAFQNQHCFGLEKSQ